MLVMCEISGKKWQFIATNQLNPVFIVTTIFQKRIIGHHLYVSVDLPARFQMIVLVLIAVESMKTVGKHRCHSALNTRENETKHVFTCNYTSKLIEIYQTFPNINNLSGKNNQTFSYKKSGLMYISKFQINYRGEGEGRRLFIMPYYKNVCLMQRLHVGRRNCCESRNAYFIATLLQK